MICRSLPLDVCLVLLGASAASAAPEKISYNDHVQPILAENCFLCHGPDSGTRKGKLRLDRAEFATAKRDDLPAITPGKPEASALVIAGFVLQGTGPRLVLVRAVGPGLTGFGVAGPLNPSH